MKLSIYKICPICNRELQYNRKYFKRYGHKVNGLNYHLVCRECENKIAEMKEWKDGKLLCRYCLQYKPESDFGNDGKNGKKLRNYKKTACKSCITKRQKYHNRSLNDEMMLDKCLRWRYLSARDRAKRHNLDFNLTFEYIKELWNKQEGKCALSGIQMTFQLQEGRTPTNVSIDKIDRTKGYTTDNIQLVCMACNQMKSDLSEGELYYFCQQIVKTYENKNKENSEYIERKEVESQA